MAKYSYYLDFDTFNVHRIPTKKYLALCQKFPKEGSEWQKDFNSNTLLETVREYPIAFKIDAIAETVILNQEEK